MIKRKHIKEQQQKKNLSDLVSLSQNNYIYGFSFWFCICNNALEMTTGLCVTAPLYLPLEHNVLCLGWTPPLVDTLVLACHYVQSPP